jgi:hypothetical protein
MSDDPLGYGALIETIERAEFQKDDTAYLLSATWLREFAKAKEDRIPPGEIDNSSIRDKRGFKPGLVEKEHYFVVPAATYDSLERDFGSLQPRLPCPFDVFGFPNLYPISLTFTHNGTTNQYSISKTTLFGKLIPKIAADFGLSHCTIYSSDAKPVAFTATSTVGQAGGPAEAIRKQAERTAFLQEQHIQKMWEHEVAEAELERGSGRSTSNRIF